MRVDVMCVNGQDGSNALKRMIRKEYHQNFYGIFHQFRDLNISFEVNNKQKF